MIKFTKKYKYDEGKMDKEVIDLCDVMNSLPGIETSESCFGHGCDSFRIWFKVKETDEGLFFLTRCVDHRYWKYGYLWNIDLYVGDMFDGNYLPISYCLNSGPIVGEDAYEQSKFLIDNMNYHLNIDKFKEYYKINLNKFDL